MKEDLEARFGRFERALEKIAGPDPSTQAPIRPQLQPPPAQTPATSEPETPRLSQQQTFIRGE